MSRFLKRQNDKTSKYLSFNSEIHGTFSLLNAATSKLIGKNVLRNFTLPSTSNFLRLDHRIWRMTNDES